MATTYQLKSYAEPAWDVKNCTIKRISKAEDITAAKVQTINNVFQAFKLPVGAKILGGGIICEELEDTANNITLTWRVTNGTTTHAGITASTVAQAGGLALFPVAASTTATIPAALGFVTDDQDYRVEILVAAAAVTGIAANLQAFVEYSMDTESGERTF